MEEKETENIVKIINGKFPAMSRGQRKLAEYILAQYDKAAFLTAAQIGKQVSVSQQLSVLPDCWVIRDSRRCRKHWKEWYTKDSMKHQPLT